MGTMIIFIIFDIDIRNLQTTCYLFKLVLLLGCEVGYYGKNCSTTCDHCKNNASCGIQSGECDSLGCATGYIKTGQSETCERKTIHILIILISIKISAQFTIMTMYSDVVWLYIDMPRPNRLKYVTLIGYKFKSFHLHMNKDQDLTRLNAYWHYPFYKGITNSYNLRILLKT